MGEINWTKEQLDVINSVDTNTLVSASAGSGKTAVMIERVVRIITGENCQKKTPLRRIIMVTFNESVASELKGKISSNLAKRLAGGEDKDYIRQQIEDVAIADISTVHSLCSTIIKNNFEYLGIQPSFSIVDEEEKKTLFGKAIANVMKEYRESYDYQVDTLINILGGEKRFNEVISDIYAFLEAQLDREGYLNDIALSSYDGDFKNSRLAKRYYANWKGAVFQLYHQAKDRDWVTLWTIADVDRNKTIAEQLENCLKVLDSAKDVEQLYDIAKKTSFEAFKVLPKSKADEYADRHKEFKAFRDSVKALIDDIKKYFPMPYSSIVENVDSCRSYLTLLIDILKKVYAEYNDLKRKDNKMDFADLEYYAVKVMQDDDIAKELAQCYDYICVDEYQDINPVQEYILSRLSNGKNLFMVGDIKQSIYQFRMTDPRIFLDKYRKYKKFPQDGSSFALNSNYRSCKEVVDFVNDIFNVIMSEDMGGVNYKKESQLIQGNTKYALQEGNPIRIAHFGKETNELEIPPLQDGVYSVRQDAQEGKATYSQEGEYIARQIKSLVGKKQIQVSAPDGGMVFRPIKYSDITLLCASRSSNVARIVEQLKASGIPVDSGNILKEKKNTCVTLFTSFVRVVDNYRQDIPLTEILTSKVFANFTYKDMASIRAAYPKEDFFHQAVDKYRREKDDTLAHKLNDFVTMLDKYRAIASFTGVNELLRKVIADFNYREYVTSLDDGATQFAGLESFINSLSGKPYNVSLAKFVEAADATEEFGKVSGEVGYDGDCVATDTIHRSKGLEYPIVFIIDACRGINRMDLDRAHILYDKTYGLAIKNFEDNMRVYFDSTPLMMLKDYKVREILEERMRLFYVAVTRARNMLYITGSGSLGRSNDKAFGERFIGSPTSMMDWLNNIANINAAFMDKYYDGDANKEDTVDGLKVVSVGKRQLVDLDVAKDFAKELQKSYSYGQATTLLIKHTVTAVNEEYYNSICGEEQDNTVDILDAFKDSDYTDEQVADKRNTADEGVAYHRVMECIDYNCFTLDDVIAQIDSMVEQGLLSDEQRKVVDPKSILGCLESEVMQAARKHTHYREKQFMLNLPAKDFLQVDSDDKVLLQGTVDLFIHGSDKGGENILVDFKFSHKSVEQLKKRYRRQLELYAMAIEECLGIKVDKKIIFVLGRNMTVII